MRIYIFSFSIFCYLLLITQSGNAQTDSTIKISTTDTLSKLNMDAARNRPYLINGKSPLAIGGYVEANTQFSQTDGINDGYSFQFRRLTLFFSSVIARKIRFMSELEFEDGTKEINIESATFDMEFHPLVNLRGGIILNPIGAFNQNHDGPRWDFVDRPIASTTIIPSTLSNVGFGLLGKKFSGNWILGYELYLTNGFDDKIISNNENRTSLAAGKNNPEKFEESNSGSPMFSGKLAIRNRNIGEIGISYLTGVYNKWRDDGLIVDNKRKCSIVAFDFNTSFSSKLNITGEIAKVFVDIPSNYTQQYGSEQSGFFTDIIYTVLQRKILDWQQARLNAGVRFEYADYNQGNFIETGKNISDDVWAVVPTIAFRPAGNTVLRFNYRYQEDQDILGNPAAKTATWQFGFSTYF